VSGTMVDEKAASISVFDHGLLYGDGVFEGIRVYNRRIFKLGEHLDRMYDSAKAIFLTIPLQKEDFRAEIIRTCRENGITSGYLRVIVTRGVGDLSLNPFICTNQQYIIIAKEVDPLLGEKSIVSGVDVITSSVRRAGLMAIPVRAKTLNYLNSVLALAQALKLGRQEAILFSEGGYVTEGSGDNIFVIKNGTVITPPASAGALKGITRETVIALSRQGGYEVREENMTSYDLFTADEMFITGTLAEIVPVRSVDGQKIGGGEAGMHTKKIASMFRAFTSQERADY